MRKFAKVFSLLALGFVAACDLQPKISTLPDTVGDFISARYPALLADPNTEPDIYNSAAGDYGIYASPELYGSSGVDDYVNYAGMDDYVLQPEEPESEIIVVETDTTQEEVNDTKTVTDNLAPEEVDTLEIPEYEVQELNVPARAVAGTVVVRRGDTLYAIAHEHNMKVQEIAKLNNLSEPYTIRIGQVLKIEKPVEKSAEKIVVPEKTAEPKKVTEAKPVEKKEVAKTAEKPVTKVTEKPKQVEPKLEAKTEVKDVRVPVKTVTVARGDTLYSLSRKYSVPVNDLAVMNKLSAPFTLSVGQTLRVPDLPVRASDVKTLASPESKVEKPAKVSTKEATRTADKAKKQEIKKVTTDKKTKTDVKQKADTKKAEVKHSSHPKKTETKKTETKTAQKAAQNQTPKIAARSSSKFSWPVRGTILSHYGAKTGGLYNDGINISVATGTAVLAAENGVVAYAGNEVRGMGNLIIIQHADGWMTVYAHMSSMNVRRGARVTVGQKIGAVGQTGKVTKPQLHFEIRKGTKAYNPINYLKK